MSTDLEGILEDHHPHVRCQQPLLVFVERFEGRPQGRAFIAWIDGYGRIERDRHGEGLVPAAEVELVGSVVGRKSSPPKAGRRREFDPGSHIVGQVDEAGSRNADGVSTPRRERQRRSSRCAGIPGSFERELEAVTGERPGIATRIATRARRSEIDDVRCDRLDAPQRYGNRTRIRTGEACVDRKVELIPASGQATGGGQVRRPASNQGDRKSSVERRCRRRARGRRRTSAPGEGERDASRCRNDGGDGEQSQRGGHPGHTPRQTDGRPLWRSIDLGERLVDHPIGDRLRSLGQEGVEDAVEVSLCRHDARPPTATGTRSSASRAARMARWA